jgi:hypothetical protein
LFRNACYIRCATTTYPTRFYLTPLLTNNNDKNSLQLVDLSDVVVSYNNNNCNNKNSPGWKTLHVFYGNDNHMEVHTGKMAQAQQDKIVATLLQEKRNGYYIDLAANDATYLLNMYMLEQNYNWTGCKY